jgi:hypothetical protein
MRSLVMSSGFLGLLLAACSFAACSSSTSTGPSALGDDGGDSSTNSTSSGTTSSGTSATSSGATASGGSSSGTSSGGSSSGSTGPGYHVVGNQVLDGTGAPHLFRGLARPSTEWNSQGQYISQADFRTMAQTWGANVVRVTMNQDFWLSASPNYDSSYSTLIDQEVQWAESFGMDVILDLHWSDQGDFSKGCGTNPASGCQECMADQNSVTFWQQVASMYANDGHVLFELYNEPFKVSAQVWLNGGPSTSGGCPQSFTAVGMQTLYNTVRAVAPNNLVIIGGLDYSYDLSAVSGSLVQGSNIIYNTHPYSYKCGAAGCSTSDWDTKFGFMTANYPVIATEFGNQDCSAGFYQTFTSYAKSKGISWTGWAYWAGGCSFPGLISDLGGTPVSGSGTTVQNALLNP